MPAWPSSLPVCVLDDGYQEAPEQNVAEFATEVGPPLRRRRSSIASSMIQHSLVLDDTELQTLLDFYKDDCKDGAVAFTRTHPRDDLQEISMTFVSPPQVTRLAPYWRVNLSLRQMP